MRVFAIVLILAPSLVRAEETPAARAARLAAIDDTGALRDATLRAPTIVGDVKTGLAVERAPVAMVQQTASVSGALEDLAERQMERSASVLDHCVAEAKRRDPSVHGDLPLAVTVVQRKASAVVTAPADVVFKACIAASAKTLRLSLPDMTFPWHLDLGKPTQLSRK